MLKMAVQLSKGQRVDLTKGTNLTNIEIGLGWATNKYKGNAEFDLDASVFLLKNDGKVSGDLDFIFYNNLIGGNGSVTHTGDNREGGSDGDDEVIEVKLDKVPEQYHRIVIVVTIDEAESRKQTFGQVENAYIAIRDMNDNNKELMRYNLGEGFSVETAVTVGEIYRHEGEWKFNAVGSGYEGGLYQFCKDFGVSV